jgi:DEAD/DEAH box helicase domain-containing protein
VSRVVGFKKIKFYTNENVGSGELDLPEQQMHTTAYWLTVPASVMASLPYASDDRRDGVVGLAFALKQVAQLLLMCDGHDVGISISGFGVRDSNPESQIPNPDGVRVFIYDNYPGGIGFSAPLFQMHDELARSTRHLIADCPCESGCPGCVGPIGNTGPLAKAAALRILDLLLEGAPQIVATVGTKEAEVQAF